MNETGHRTKVLAAWLVCMSMLTGLVVLLPQDVSAAPPEGLIVGNVNDGTNPLPNSYVLVMAMLAGAQFENSTWTDGSGDYMISVIGGMDYMVMAFNNSCYAGSAMARALSGETAYANFTLEHIAPAVTDVTLVGFVKDELGNPVTDGNIGGYTNDPANMGEGAPLYVNMTKPDVTGMYTVTVLPSIAGGGIAALDFPGYPFQDNGTKSPIVSGETYWFNITLRPASFNDDATLSGTVTDLDTGLPIENVLVSYEVWNETTDEGYSNMTWTDPSGHYFMNVVSGSYARVIMSKIGYTMFMMEGLEVLPGEDEVLDATLRATSATVRGNVTDLNTGDGIPFARVFLFDYVGNMNMAIANGTGGYTLDAFDGSNLIIGAEADGYGRNSTVVNITAGDMLWMDFGLRAIDAWVTGKVTDAITGDPIANAGLHFWAPSYDQWAETDAPGDYNVTLVSDDYTVEANALDYRTVWISFTVFPGANSLDIELTPWDIPDTVKLYGWVNSTSTMSGISGATVKVGEGAPNYGEQNSTMMDVTGYYEMWIPPIGLHVVGNATDHTHSETMIDASGMTEVRVDMLLTVDLWAPNVTYTQSPTDNVSWTNPSWIRAEAQELDMRQLFLWHFRSNGSAGMWTYYYAIEMLWDNFDPTAYSQNNLPYWIIGDRYIVDQMWFASVSAGGTLWNGTDDLYLGSYEVWWGPDVYNAIRGYYWNSSMMGPEGGTAWFDQATEQFSFFTFDDGSIPTATLDDPTGVFLPVAPVMQVDEGTGSWWWTGNQVMGQWSVVDSVFLVDTNVPSGKYATVYAATDWADHGWAEMTLLTVDNDPPVADAGPGQQAIEGVLVTLDGSGSYDNVGIVSYEWSFSDGGLVMLFGETVDYAFTTVGNHTITLTVTDGAGHTDVATTWVEVLADELPVADAGPDQDVEVNTVVTFDGTNSTDDIGIVNYTWSVVELSQELYGPTPQYTFTMPGMYNVTLVVEDTAGQSSAPDEMVVTVRDVTPPTADAGTDQLRMGGELVTLDASASYDDVGIVNWTWTFDYEGSPVVLWGEIVTFTFWTEDVYNIMLNVTDAAGHWDTDVVQVTISGMIPEFPTLLLPIMGMVVLLLFVRARARRR